MAFDEAAFKKELRTLHRALAADLVARADRPEVEPALRAAHRVSAETHRTGEDYALWRRHFAEQAASAWTLSTLFARVLEDRGFLRRRRIAGPEARESRDALAHLAPHLGTRDYLLVVFQELMEFDAARPLFEPRHNLAWHLGPSEDGARRLIQHFETPDAADPTKLAYTFPGRPERGPAEPDRVEEPFADTRLLGDIYEDLDEDARKRFALLQTPHFVESFILDRTLTPALATFGLGSPEDPIRLIDPACGSGHFLLDAFARLYRRWSEEAPAAGRVEWVRRALRSVAGVDVNPFAVAIARFRLTLAALEAADLTTLEGAPAFDINVTTADTLLWGGDGQGAFRDSDGAAWTESQLFEVENRAEIERIFGRRYQVVVGNPPYIAPKDDVLNAEYRKRYETCYRAYSLAVPFTERFFQLAVEGGYLGMITANSFMKREFGRKLIEEYLPGKDLTAIYDTSGARFPGHGTPTVILIGRNQPRTRDVVPMAMGVRAEPGKPSLPERGLVWQSIAEHGDQIGFQNAYISVSEVPGATLSEHPWCPRGGGAAELKARLERHANRTLARLDAVVGFMVVTREDDAYVTGGATARLGVPAEHQRPLALGESVRNWSVVDVVAIWPYTPGTLFTATGAGQTACERVLWPMRALLTRRIAYGHSQLERGLTWFEYSMFFRERYPGLTAAYAEVATHNHFVLDRAGRVFTQSAPVVKLPGATEDEHLELLGLLNSSTLGFWMRQVFQAKAGSGIGRGIQPEGWMERIQYDGTKLQRAPLVSCPAVLPYARALDALGQEVSRPLLDGLPPAALASPSALRAEIAARLARRREVLACMRGLQEELDWLVYEAYGLIPPGAGRVLPPEQVPLLTLGHRPFEIAMARQVAAGELETAWFERHGSTPTTEIPDCYPPEYRERVQARLDLIASVHEIGLIEQPEYKRRWSADDLDERVKGELRERLLDRIETARSNAREPQSVRAIAHGLEREPEVRALGEVFADRPDFDLERLAGELLAEESVPAFVACRYTATGLEKRATWERVWDLQRREDRGEKVGEIEPPQKYTSADFQGNAWTHRGKLDVPKERFVSYPGCEGGGDPTPLYGWAGWDHLQRARALAQLFERRRREDRWEGDRLVPMLAGMHELVPWLLQWHNEPSVEFDGERPGEAFDGWFKSQLGALALSRGNLEAWRPARAGARRGRPSSRSSPGGRGGANALDPERVLATLRDLGGEAALKPLAEALGAPQTAVRAAADALVEGGRLALVRKKPITYGLTAEPIPAES